MCNLFNHRFGVNESVIEPTTITAHNFLMPTSRSHVSVRIGVILTHNILYLGNLLFILRRKNESLNETLYFDAALTL